MEKRLYHITSEAEANAAERTGEYVPKAFDAEGFIHCSYARQVPGTLNRIFKGRTDLVVFEIDPAKLSCRVVEENLEGGSELFPHIYGLLPMSAVVRSIPVGAVVEGVNELSGEHHSPP
jgi:uncharacterized protein (DUF952 family)